jgi:hypothetical protein
VTGAVLQRAVIEEMQAVRDEIARAHDYDIDAIIETSRRMEASSGRHPVALESRRPARPGTAADGASRRHRAWSVSPDAFARRSIA